MRTLTRRALFGLFAAVSLQKSVRDRMEGIKVTGIYFGLCWVALGSALLLLSVGLWNAQIAFKDFQPVQGVLNSPWVGLEHFQAFFSSFYFSQLMTNTLLISFAKLLIGLPPAIILAIAIHESTRKGLARVTQTVTHQVKCQHRQQDRQTREGHDPPGALRELQHVGEHGAPLRRWRLCPHAEETKSSHIENGVRETERRLNNQRRKAVREDVNKHLTHRPGTRHARRGDVIAVNFHQHGGAG